MHALLDYITSDGVLSNPLHPPQPSPQIKGAVAQVSDIADKFKNKPKFIQGLLVVGIVDVTRIKRSSYCSFLGL